jgi:pSer/pThr/pTyr-binding forkhead associated (FHA) protein
MEIRLTWEEPATGERKQPLLNTPIAFGREFGQLPADINGARVSRVVLNSEQVSRRHATIVEENGIVKIRDENSSNGIKINGTAQPEGILRDGDMVQIGPYDISIVIAVQNAPPVVASSRSQILFNPVTNLPDPNYAPPPPVPQASVFPPPSFTDRDFVEVAELKASGVPVMEVEFAAIGGGLGSFVWVDYLRISGIPTSSIGVFGNEAKPYARYARLCLNSQIPLHERLRSNADSCPDNIWGFPNYAVREAFYDLGNGKIGNSVGYLWQMFAEPLLADTYTPQAGNVFASVDREAARIGWGEMWRFARVKAIRKTSDGRYAIAYSGEQPGSSYYAIGKYLHIALGYPAIQFLPDLQSYRERTRDFYGVVNAYEDHERVYQTIARQGGTILLRGRGIVASRLLQKIYEVRQASRQEITVIQLLRSPLTQGHKHGLAQRYVEYHTEFQPFNWPKSCWGGELKTQLAASPPDRRQQIFADLGGTTTAKRSDWRRIVAGGLSKGWYQIKFGEVVKVEPLGNSAKTITHFRDRGTGQESTIQADFIIDGTGLDGRVKENPLIADLFDRYRLPLNPSGRMAVTPGFELAEMNNQQGRIYAAGAMTFGNYYAPVDSFLGLQYAALAAIDDLRSRRTTNIKSLNSFRSIAEWFRWVANSSPR